MLANLKSQFYSLIKGLGYNITDNAEYKEQFPWLMLRTNGYRTMNSFNVNISSAVLVLDIFSTYSGEKEIIEIVENIVQRVFAHRHGSAFHVRRVHVVADDEIRPA